MTLDAAIERTAARFARASTARASAGYVASKLRRDPAVAAIAGRAPLGDVIDIGCGRGQLAVLLLESGAASRVLGLDHDAEKVALATRAAEGLSATFRVGDARAGDEGEADTVLLVDVLHYMPPDDQDALLRLAASLVRPGGRVLVREATTGMGLRTALTRAAEHVGVALRVNRGQVLAFRDVARELVPVLEGAGLRCAVEPCWAGTPLANVLLEARR
ncbi:MAG: class I SAM-dependent methyltransferase [Myxococcales bacterium]|nr:class I SAM-dependent methyltransferase [Myxococcales bacterium]